jgi:hypothetical protein
MGPVVHEAVEHDDSVGVNARVGCAEFVTLVGQRSESNLEFRFILTQSPRFF